MKYFVLIAVVLLGSLAGRPVFVLAQERTLTIDFAAEQGAVKPRVGFLGGLRDQTPDDLLKPLHPALWRIGHQFRGRIAAGLPAAVDRVQSLGASYKLVMSDLIGAKPQDWPSYEEAVKKLVAQVGQRSRSIIWEPVNEPDISHKPIDTYYQLYAHAFKALREADPQAQICGPGYAYPTYDKYKAFLDYCQANKLECNYLAWHYTGWDAHKPQQGKWGLGEMRQFIGAYKDQKIREIHCDEWGAGPDKPGRLHPGRAVVWFYYLENVYKVDRACRANWGKQDDYLGGIITADNRPHPVYHVYRWYGTTAGQTRLISQGDDRTIACLASKTADSCQILVGTIDSKVKQITLELQNLNLPKGYQLKVHLVPNTDMEGALSAGQIPQVTDFDTKAEGQGLRVTLKGVQENQAYQVVLK